MASKKKETKQAEVDESEDAAMETELFLAVLKSRLGRYGHLAWQVTGTPCRSAVCQYKIEVDHTLVT
jgi:hypothetical protein